MMGKQAPQDAKLFYYDISLERRIPKNHLLRKIKDILDFDFVYPLVKDCYGKNGNVSIQQKMVSVPLKIIHSKTKGTTPGDRQKRVPKE